MRPDDIALLEIPGQPAVAPDGTILVALARPDVENDRYSGSIRMLAPGGVAGDFTRGPRDSEPVISPDGHTVLFLRAAETGPPQLYRIDLRGGEARRLTSHTLGAGRPVFSPDGDRIAYLAPVPEQGRYGTDPDIKSEAEPPRPIARLSYRRDGKGFLPDRPDQVFVLHLDQGGAGEALQLTDEADVVGGPAFLPDGRIAYLRSVGPDRPQGEFAVISAQASGEPGTGNLLAELPGNASTPVVSGDSICYYGVGFTGNDMAGRTTGLWSIPTSGGQPRRLTDEEIEVDTNCAAVPLNGAVLISVVDRGAVLLCAVPIDADRAPMARLTVILGGHRVVSSFGAAPAPAGGVTVAAVVADPGSPGELVSILLTNEGQPYDDERLLTDLAGPLRATGLAEHQEIFGVAPDGYPVHGFLLLPKGSGPHPVLLVIHGGPHAAYGWGLFDEAQVYADAGYAVVLPNPRGSAGYGHDHGRTILRRLGTVDADDVLALLDAALERPELDGDRVGVMGGSYGGFMTSWLASQAPGRFTAAISERALNAWDSFVGSSDIGYFFAANYVGGDREDQWRASPLAYADDISLPLLIIHSENDWRCPIEQGQRLFVALKSRGAEVEMLLFPAEGHELSRSGRPRHRLQRFAAILDWWRRWVPVG